MSSKRWTVGLDGRPHEVILHHGYFSARRRISVDGVEVLDVRPAPLEAVRLWNTATEHAFVIAGHPCAIRIDSTIDNMTYKKFLIVDGRDIDSGAPLAALPEIARGQREGRWMAGYGGVGGFALTMLGVIVAVVAFQLLQRH